MQEIELQGRGYNDTKTMIAVKEQELQKHKRAIDKLHESYEEDIITKQVFMERKVMRFRELWDIAVSSEEKNRALKNLVERIVYNREGNRVE